MSNGGEDRGSSASVVALGPCGPEELASQFEDLSDGAQVIAVFLEIAKDVSAGRAADAAVSFQCPSVLAVRGDGTLPRKLVDAFDLCFIAPNVSLRIGEAVHPAEEAAGMGFVNRVIRDEAIFEDAYRVASSISELAPKALEACKRAVREGAGLQLEEGLRLEITLFSDIFATRDMKEGTRAFLEKRAPVFRGE